MGFMQCEWLLSSCALPNARQGGASLIEVLVAVMLLSTGLAGMAGLLSRGNSFNHDAYLRSQGTALAADMVGRIRTHAQACATPDTEGRLLSCALVTGDGEGFDGAASQACGEPLSTVASAAADANQWKSCLERGLPDGRGRVSYLAAGTAHVDLCGARRTAAAMPLFVVEVSWAEHRLATPNGTGRECVALHTAAVGP